MAPGSPPPDGARRSRVAALIAVVVLAVVAVLVAQAISRHNVMQNCIDSGRRDCDERLQTP